jgi:hypothetical protein
MIRGEASDCIGPEAPVRIKRSKVGSFPFDRKSFMTLNVAPSRQKSTTKGSDAFR